MKVHTSNFRIVGFTEEVAPPSSRSSARELGIVDGLRPRLGPARVPAAPPLDALGGEPLVRDAVASGVDVVTFSGDKLLGAPQAGLVVGKREAVRALRKNPIYRALRLTRSRSRGSSARSGCCSRAAATSSRRGDAARDGGRARPAARRIAPALAALRASGRGAPRASQPGSGSAPDVFLDTFVRARRAAGALRERARAALRRGEPPVFARIQDGAVLLDPRTLLAGDLEHALEAFRQLA